MPVMDASVLVAYLGEREGEVAERASDLFAADRDELFAPHLVDAEVGDALRRLVAARELDSADAEGALVDLADLPIRRSPHTWLLDSAWRLRSSVSFYDALYLALGQELELTLVTLDARLARTATKLGVEAELLGGS
jgi:predicted nucleic acid-binding protein